MKIIDKFKKDTPIYSIEFFPPKSEVAEEQLEDVLKEFSELSPAFCSVTYGAMGSSQDKTIHTLRKVKRHLSVEVMSHFTCIGLTEEKIDRYLDQLIEEGIENVLALRGDIPADTPRGVALSGAYQYANQLVAAIRKKRKEQFGICVAAYPEKHPEALSHELDIENLKRKVESGADFIITQLFYDNDDFYRFRDVLRDQNINCPIVAGIMPIQSSRQISIIAGMCGASIPVAIQDFFDTNPSSEDQIMFGIEYASLQCEDLLKQGVDGLHFYCMNKSYSIKTILKHLKMNMLR